MKKVLIVLSLILVLTLTSCGRFNNHTHPTTSEYNPPYTRTPEVPETPKDTLTKGVVYSCGTIYTGNDSHMIMNINQSAQTYTLPELKSETKENMSNKTLTVNNIQITLSYDESYRPQNVSYWVDDYKNTEYGVSVGYLENTDTIYTFYAGELNIFAKNEKPNTENDYLAICNEFMKDKADFNVYTPSCRTRKITTNQYGVNTENFYSFVSVADSEGVEVFYEFKFQRYINGIEAADVITITLNKDGSLDSFMMGAAGDFSPYQDMVIDLTDVYYQEKAAVNRMYTVSNGYVLQNVEFYHTLTIVENKLCLYSFAAPYIIESSSERMVTAPQIMLLLPLM